jgi:hypothetical protein
MASGAGKSSGGGCGALIAIALVVGAIVAAAMSLAALVDPFNWMPSVAEIWADCDGDCELAHRFPGFWWHVISNLTFAAVAVAATVWFGATVVDLREARAARYDSAQAMADFRKTRSACAIAGMALAALASVSIIVSVA